MRDTAETTLILQREFKAPVAKLYAAWVTPEQFCKWMGPMVDMACVVDPFDVSVGGKYGFTITAPDGGKHSARGVFKEIVENTKLVFTWTWDHVPERETLVTVEFRSNGETSSLTLTHEGHTDADTRNNHRGGWTGSLDKLETLLLA